MRLGPAAADGAGVRVGAKRAGACLGGTRCFERGSNLESLHS